MLMLMLLYVVYVKMLINYIIVFFFISVSSLFRCHSHWPPSKFAVLETRPPPGPSPSDNVGGHLGCGKVLRIL